MFRTFAALNFAATSIIGITQDENNSFVYRYSKHIHFVPYLLIVIIAVNYRMNRLGQVEGLSKPEMEKAKRA